MKHVADGRVKLQGCPRVDLELDVAERYFLRKGDLLFNRTNSLEHVGKLGLVYSDSDTVFASYLVRLRVKRGYSPVFLAAFLNLADTRSRLRRLATPGVAQYNINATELKRQVFVPAPPLAEQQEIVEILSTCDERVEMVEELVRAKQRLKQALVQQLLTGRRRMERFRGSGESALTRVGAVPQEWAWSHLGQVFRKRKDRSKDALPLMAVTIDSGMVPREIIERKLDSQLTAEDNLVARKGDIAYNTMRMWQGAVGIAREDCHISPAYVVCSPIEDVADSEFFIHWFKSAVGRHLLTSYSYGITGDRLRLYFPDFTLVPAPLPPIEEQRAIVAVLQTADGEIEALNRKLVALKRQKKALMQKLLTGQVRVEGSHV